MTASTISPQGSPAARTRMSRPKVDQGAAIHRLIAACKPLDLNSRYAYLLLCEHFADTCVVARARDRIVGFVSAYRLPHREDTVFVWQVAVDSDMRGGGMAAMMLDELLTRTCLRGCRYLETTVSPSNTPSRRLFHALARRLRAPLHERVLFADCVFGEEHHECEQLIRIGPFRANNEEATNP